MQRFHIKVRRFQIKVLDKRSSSRFEGLYLDVKIRNLKDPAVFQVPDGGSKQCFRFYVPHF